MSSKAKSSMKFYTSFRERWIEATSKDHPEASELRLCRHFYDGGAMLCAIKSGNNALAKKIEDETRPDDQIAELDSIFQAITTLVDKKMSTVFFDCGYVATMEILSGRGGARLFSAIKEFLNTDGSAFKALH